MPDSTPAIFSTSYTEDTLGLDDKGVVDILDFDREEVAQASKVSSSSVRYDDNMPRRMRRRIQEWKNILNLAASFFKGDRNKLLQWIVSPNPMLGNTSPREAIRFGRSEKLLKYILDSKEEHGW